MTNLDKLIQEKVGELVALSLEIAIARGEEDTDTIRKKRLERLEFFKQSLKDIAYKSIEAEIKNIKIMIEGIEKWQKTHNTHHHALYVSMIKADLKGIIFESAEKEKEFKGL